MVKQFEYHPVSSSWHCCIIFMIKRNVCIEEVLWIMCIYCMCVVHFTITDESLGVCKFLTRWGCARKCKLNCASSHCCMAPRCVKVLVCECVCDSIWLCLNKCMLFQIALHKCQSRVHQKAHCLPPRPFHLPGEIAYPLNLSACCSIQGKLPFVHKDATRRCRKNILGFITCSDNSGVHPCSSLFLFFFFFISRFRSDELRGWWNPREEGGGWMSSRHDGLQLRWEREGGDGIILARQGVWGQEVSARLQRFVGGKSR